jgi:hypothetical protein
VRITTDLGDWGDIPIRVRLAFITIVLLGAGTGIAVGIGWLSLLGGFLLIANGGIAVQWFFTRRRPWWKDEAGGDDIVDRNFNRRFAIASAIDAVFVVLMLAGKLTV